MTQAAEKVRNNSILQYPNAPLMASFGGTKEAAINLLSVITTTTDSTLTS